MMPLNVISHLGCKMFEHVRELLLKYDTFKVTSHSVILLHFPSGISNTHYMRLHPCELALSTAHKLIRAHAHSRRHWFTISIHLLPLELTAWVTRKYRGWTTAMCRYRARWLPLQLLDNRGKSHRHAGPSQWCEKSLVSLNLRVYVAIKIRRNINFILLGLFRLTYIKE